MVFGSMYGSDGNSEGKGSGGQSVNRQPAVAGQFYPATKEALRSKLRVLFSKAMPQKLKNVVALIVPHAGYDYSGSVAASGFNQLEPDKTYEHIFVLAPSHRTSIRGAAVYCRGDYLSPLGVVHVDRDLAKSLLQKSEYIIEDDASHKYEHSLEVELPFLQFLLKRNFKILPLVIGTQDPMICSKLAEVLSPHFNSGNLFIISSDFSHFPTYQDANMVDMLSLRAIEKNDPAALSKVIIENERLGIPGLATCMCGLGPVLTLLYITRDQPDLMITPLIYKNSGDASFGDKHNVVGYHAIAFSLKKNEADNYNQLFLSASEKEDLLKLARTTIDHYVKYRSIPETEQVAFTENLKKYSGAFDGGS